jgi:TusA-related sulfurtransferase
MVGAKACITKDTTSIAKRQTHDCLEKEKEQEKFYSRVRKHDQERCDGFVCRE